MSPKNILIVAGEPSGDLHASNLVKDLKNLNPNLRFFGLGGELCKNAGVDVGFDISTLALVGLVEVWKNILTIGRVFKGALKRVDAERPDLAILVDYPGFNLRLAKELKRRNIPVIYYISPQIWAWGKDRINIIKKCVTKMIVFFKFEEELYKKNGVDVEFVGHPLIDTVRASLSKSDFLKKYKGLGPEKTTIALLPGSRMMEIKRLLPVMIVAAKLIAKNMGDCQFVVSKFKDLPAGLYDEQIANSGLNINVIEGDTYNVVNASDLAIVASGTATLETAILGTPSIVIYRTNWLTAFVAFRVKTIKFIGLVNIIAGRELSPEFLQSDATPENISQKAIELLNDPNKLSQIKMELTRIKTKLGSPGATSRAARAILPFLQ